MKRILFSLAVMALIFQSCGGSFFNGSSSARNREASTSAIYFETTKYEKVLAMAQEEQKPVFVDFYTDWCAPCKWMDKDAFQNESAARYFNKNMISIKLNAEEGEGVELSEKFNIKAVPTLIYLRPNGTEIERHIGQASASSIISMAKKAVKTLKDEMKEAEKGK